MKQNDQDELLIVVDELDDVLDYLPRSQVHKKKLLHRTSTVITYTSNGKLVFQKRSMDKDTNPGKLGNAIGGHVNKGESYIDAAKHEAKEELNIDIEPEFLKKALINDPIHRTMTSIFKITYDGPFNFNKQEIDEMKIFSLDEVMQHLDELSQSTKITLQEVGVL